jgi:hypothetical protein
MRLVKCGLAPLVQDTACLHFFEGVVQRAHEAKTAAYLLCKLSLLEAHERDKFFCFQDPTGRTLFDQRRQLRNFTARDQKIQARRLA